MMGAFIMISNHPKPAWIQNHRFGASFPLPKAFCLGFAAFENPSYHYIINLIMHYGESLFISMSKIILRQNTNMLSKC